MSDDFEDHCWKDIVTPDILDIYSHYRRNTFVGPAPALLAIDLYELVYRGGAKPPGELAKTFPSACGHYAYEAIEPTKRLFTAARTAGLPIFYSTGDTRDESGQEPGSHRSLAQLGRYSAAILIQPGAFAFELWPRPDQLPASQHRGCRPVPGGANAYRID